MNYKNYNRTLFYGLMLMMVVPVFPGCGKKSSAPVEPTPVPTMYGLNSVAVDNVLYNTTLFDVSLTPSIRLSFSSAINHSTVNSGVTLTGNGVQVSYNVSYSGHDSIVIITPVQSLNYLTNYNLTVNTQLKSTNGGSLNSNYSYKLVTKIDSTDKFPQISDTALVQLVQQQTFKYFWDFAHPVCGMARERNTSGDVVTTGGSGFGIMALITGVHRGFISRSQGLTRMQTIVSFLKNTAQTFHGAYPHWINGNTGAVVPFGTKDNGADLVETSFLMEGLLCARQYFNGSDATESALRDDINVIWTGVDWSWFRKNNENVLYWHWSPNYNWDMNFPIRGWNECLVTYVLAASSTTHNVPKIVYDNGWAQNGAIRNGNNYYNITLPLGPELGGPLFFEHYSFMGINPVGLADAYASYQDQTTHHTLINYEYCKANPKHQYGYSDQCWGLTASDIPNGYTASSPTNDVGVIAPTAALSSFPYTPQESMKALKFFYYKLGDKLWGPYGFYDAFSLKDTWFASSYLAIDQGPIVVMMENYRSGLLWNLFTSCPEIKSGMRTLGFTAPYL